MSGVPFSLLHLIGENQGARGALVGATPGPATETLGIYGKTSLAPLGERRADRHAGAMRGVAPVAATVRLLPSRRGDRRGGGPACGLDRVARHQLEKRRAAGRFQTAAV